MNVQNKALVRFYSASGNSTPGRWLVAALVGAACLLAADVQAAEKRPAPKLWAALIGVEDYQQVPRLKYTTRDVEVLAQTLQTYNSIPKEQIVTFIQSNADAGRQPLKSSLMEGLPRLLSQAGPADEVLIYFSGHGFRDAQGRLYLAPIDCNRRNLEGSAIPAAWLKKQLAGCKASLKLLILDACHAGSEKGDDAADEATSSAFGELFQDDASVVTLASSTANEPSQIWADKQQSLFTYWLVQGLKGSADRDLDGYVDIDDLYQFVYGNVVRTAKARFAPQTQTPARIVRSGVLGRPTVVQTQAQDLDQAVNDVAEILANAIDEHRVPRVGVLEFIHESEFGESIDPRRRLMGKILAKKLHDKLEGLGEGKFKLVNPRILEGVLSRDEFAVGDLGSTDRLRKLSTEVGGMPALVVGKMLVRNGRVLSLKCELVQTEGVDQLCSTRSKAKLTESEIAMEGRSFYLEPKDRLPRPTLREETVRPAADYVVERIDEQAGRAHPFANPQFPFAVKVMVDGQERKGEIRGNDYIVKLKKGEVYSLWVENRLDRPVCLRLLVDGLNTLPQPQKTKGVAVDVVAPRVSLEEARHWSLQPRATNAFDGFVEETGKAGSYRQFKVVDAAESAAGKQKFTDQIGTIIAAFYETGAGGSRGRIGTGLGDRQVTDLTEKDVKVGNLITSVVLRYTDE